MLTCQSDMEIVRAPDDPDNDLGFATARPSTGIMVEP